MRGVAGREIGEGTGWKPDGFWKPEASGCVTVGGVNGGLVGIDAGGTATRGSTEPNDGVLTNGKGCGGGGIYSGGGATLADVPPIVGAIAGAVAV